MTFLGLFIAVLWSPAGKGLIPRLSFVMFNSVFVTLQCGILGQVWYLIVLIPDLCVVLWYVHFNENYSSALRCFGLCHFDPQSTWPWFVLALPLILSALLRLI